MLLAVPIEPVDLWSDSLIDVRGIEISSQRTRRRWGRPEPLAGVISPFNTSLPTRDTLDLEHGQRGAIKLD